MEKTYLMKNTRILLQLCSQLTLETRRMKLEFPHQPKTNKTFSRCFFFYISFMTTQEVMRNKIWFPNFNVKPTSLESDKTYSRRSFGREFNFLQTTKLIFSIMIHERKNSGKIWVKSISWITEIPSADRQTSNQTEEIPNDTQRQMKSTVK